MLNSIRTSTAVVLLIAAACVCCVSGQAPSPPPIWPVSFQARFGLYDSPLLGPTITNNTSYFYYNLDPSVFAQLIDYPDYCPPSPILVGGIKSGCRVYFNQQGIYVSQAAENIECCLMFGGVGPTPRNFTNGFNWVGTDSQPDYYGQSRQCDHYEGGVPIIAPFRYYTEIGTHHDVLFHDGAGPNWQWDHLQVQTVDPTVFQLPGDSATCNTACPHLAGNAETIEEFQARVAKHAPIALALQHHAIANGYASGEEMMAQLARQTRGEKDEQPEIALI